MALESGTYISDLVATNPVASDGLGQADDHIRLLKSTIKATFPNINAAMTTKEEILNVLSVDITPPTNGQVLTYDSAIGNVKWTTPVSGTSDHGLLTGLGDDDHTQYYNTIRGDARYAQKTHTHSGADITSGTVGIAYLPTGTTGTTVAVGNHQHAATDVTSGTFAFARMPVGTSSTTVAQGDHQHTSLYNSGSQKIVATFLGVAVYGVCEPSSDNGGNLGGGSTRWSTVYAVNGTINTSDEREKKEILPLSQREMLAAKEMVENIKTFKWVNGNDDRKRIGVIAQQAIRILEAWGLDPKQYSFIEIPEDGPMGINYAELSMFMLAGLHYMMVR